MSTLACPHPRLAERARNVLAQAHALAASRGEEDVCAGHVMLAMLDGGQNVASYVLRQRGIDDAALSQALHAALPDASPGKSTAMDTSVWTQTDEAFAERAQREADALDSPYIGVEHLFLAFLRETDDAFTRVLRPFGVEYAGARDAVRVVNSPAKGT